MVLLLVVWMLNYSDRQVIFSMFPLLGEALHVSALQLGMLGSSFLWVYALCSPAAGWMADRFGTKWMICGSLMLWSTITWFTGHAQGFGQLVGGERGMLSASRTGNDCGVSLVPNSLAGSKSASVRNLSRHGAGRSAWRMGGYALWMAVGVCGTRRDGCGYALVLMTILREKKTDTVAKEKETRTSLNESARIILRTNGYGRMAW